MEETKADILANYCISRLYELERENKELMKDKYQAELACENKSVELKALENKIAEVFKLLRLHITSYSGGKPYYALGNNPDIDSFEGQRLTNLVDRVGYVPTDKTKPKGDEANVGLGNNE